MDEPIEIKEIISPKQAVKEGKQNTAKTVASDSKDQELHDLAAQIARKSGKPMAIIAEGNDMKVWPADKDMARAKTISDELRMHEQLVGHHDAPAKPEDQVSGKSKGPAWGTHVLPNGEIEKGPGKHKRR